MSLRYGLKGGHRSADGDGMETRSLVVPRRLVFRRLLGVAAGLFAVRWAVVPRPLTMAAKGFSPRLAATADDEGLRALFGSENRVIRTRKRVVAVTFNAAWNDAGLDRILGELSQRCKPATFFLTGDFADRYPQVVKRIAAAGHGLGNHSYSHPYFKDLTAAGRRREVRAADQALRAAGAGEALTPFFRFPYSETSPDQIREVNGLGFADIEFTTDTNGWMGAEGGMTVDGAVRRALDALRPGAILQMHAGVPDGHSEVIDAQALPRILAAITARGYTVIDLRTVLTSAAYPGSTAERGLRAIAPYPVVEGS
ncbi:polysaccharide deacetylase family protein [Streptomyces sp. NPDC048415]|uniref:polysaccharide deacetylase family protein n=1 Tax=Streptomyces sp. NPDC048415 TaxID=3154822 RepID=UPI00343CB172